MQTVTTDESRGAGPWAGLHVPVIPPCGWTRAEVLSGLREVERVRRRVDAACALLVGALGPSDRGTAALVAEAAGVSYKAARDQVLVAEVVERLDGASEALASGAVSAEHLRMLAPVADDPAAGPLLSEAAGQSPENLARTVARFQLNRDPVGLRQRQRDARSVSFFKADHGCVGMRAVLSPVEGEEFRNRVTAIADAAWRAAHPERAETLGGHDDEPYPRRLADALVAMARSGSLPRGTGSVTGKPAVVVTVDATTLEAELVGRGPIALQDALELVGRAELFACVRDTKWGVLNFGRNRRLASPLQQLALMVRDQGCVYPKCDEHWTRTEAHHNPDFADGGRTDLEWLALVCPRHHRHLHINGLELYRNDNGEWAIRPRTTDPPPDPG